MEISKRQTQKEQTKRKIVDAAFKVYSENGLSAPTSLIAKEAGVAHGSVFLHFPTLPDLLTRLIKEFGETLAARINDHLKTASNIEEFLDAHLDILSEYEDFYTALLTQAPLLPDEARNVLSVIQSGLSYRFSRLIKDGVESGALKKLPENILFNAWVGLIHYYLHNKTTFAPAGPVLKRYKKQLIFTYCELIRKQ